MLQGSLETRFLQSTSDYADVLHTRVIERAKNAAVETGLRQLIDDTTEGVLLLKYGNSVLCWLTGIPSSRKDYTGTKIRYAIALEDDPGTMRQWAGILCGLYSNQDQMQSLGTFLDGFMQQDNKAAKPDLTFDKIADFLKSKIQPVQTEGVDGGCEFVLASYLAESEDIIIKALSKGMRRSHPEGVFWNGSGFSDVKKKGKFSSATLKKSATEQKRSANASNSSELSSKTACLSYGLKKAMIIGTMVVLILLVGIGVILNSIGQPEDFKNIRLCVKELRISYNTLQEKFEPLPQAVEAYRGALTGVQDKSKILYECANAVEQASKNTQDNNLLTQKIASLQQEFKDYNRKVEKYTLRLLAWNPP